MVPPLFWKRPMKRQRLMQILLHYHIRSWNKSSVPIHNLYEVEGEEKKSTLTNCRFTTILSQISAIYMSIFHKTEGLTVILRCWMSLYLNWVKSAIFFIFGLVQFCKKKTISYVLFLVIFAFLRVFHFFHNFLTNWYIEQFSTSKWPSELQFCER